MKVYCFGLMIILVGCNHVDQGVSDPFLNVYDDPQVVPLNTDGGYSINSFSGDSIKPLINSLGDTILTGSPVPARGKVMDPGSFEKPRIVPAGRPLVVPAHLYLNNLPGAFTVIPIDSGSLHKVPIRLDLSFFDHQRLNRTKEIKEIAIPATCKPVSSSQPEPVKSLPPMMKYNARTNMKFLDVEQGMSSSNLIAVLEDSHGHIWIGTQTKGVSMYNGETFRHYMEKEGLCNNYVTCFMEDDHENIWIGTHDGISIYDGSSFMNFNLEEDQKNIAVWSMMKDSYGYLWIGTDEGVFIYDGESLEHLTENDGLINKQVWSVVEDSHGLIWIGTIAGVSIYNGKSFTHLTKENGLSSNRVWSMLKDNQDRIWIGTDVGLNLYDGEYLTHITEEDGLTNNVVRTILEDSQGNIWFGTHGGVNRYDGWQIMHITGNEGLSGTRIRAVQEDSRGNFWFVTENGGISILFGGAFTYFTRQDGFKEEGITSILEDRHGNFWFGSWGSGVSRYNGNNFSHFTQKEGLIQNAPMTMLEDRKGNLWIGTFDGLCSYDGNTFTHYTDEQGLSDNHIRSILEDSQGNIWIGTTKCGVNMYDGKTFTHFTESEGLVDDRIKVIKEDHQGNIWIGTANGISKYNGDTFTHFTEKEGLSHNLVLYILEDSRGNMWFGTNGGGVNMFDGTTFTYFTEKQGLSSNQTTSLAEDHNHQIWISTMTGINCITFDRERHALTSEGMPEYKPVVYAFGLKDGLKSAEIIPRNVLLDRENRIWWGSPRGVILLDPDHLEIQDTQPVVQLEQVDINGQFIDYRQSEENPKMRLQFSGVPRFYNYPLQLELPYNHNHLTMHFTAKDWTSSMSIRYAYFMEGMDDHWSQPSAQAFADYRNMPPGRYTFKVMAIGTANKWSEAFEYSFRILPPLWLKWWIFIIYGFILILIIRWYRGFLIRREKINTDLKIKEAEVKKMQELDHMKSRFFANISHEFRTPLTLIQGPIEDLRVKLHSRQEGTIQLFQSVKRNLNRLQELINQLLDISKLETGNVRLQVAPGNLVEHLKTLILSFISLAEYKNIHYAYTLPEDRGMEFFDADKLEKILINLISNAFKYTTSGGQVRVIVRYTDTYRDALNEMVEIRVEDTGRGIRREELVKVFDRFYQAQDSESPKTEGTGLGLALVKELVDLYRGDIRVESETGKGSTFLVKLPVSADQFRDEEIIADYPETAKQEDSLETPYAPLGSRGDYFPVRSPAFGTKQKPLILVVEDNDELRGYISRILGESYRIISATNGKKGLDRALEYLPDLVVSDVMMPDMDGIEMCKKMKIDERTDHIPIVILTARADRSSKLEGLETGADDYLIKPFDSVELEVRVKNLLEQRRKLRDKFRMDLLQSEPELRLPSDQLFLNRLIDIFNQYYSDPDFKIPQLSGKLHLSQSQVRRKTLALCGYTPNEFLRYYRLKKAAIYFRSGHKNVAQVMYMVGFNNQSYFARCFYRLFGMTPSQFISAHRDQPAAHHA